MTVAVATDVEGFRTLGELVVPIAIHAVLSSAGMQMLVSAKKLGEVASAAGSSAEPTVAGP